MNNQGQHPKTNFGLELPLISEGKTNPKLYTYGASRMSFN